MIRVMRLWRDGMATPVDGSLAIEMLLRRNGKAPPARLWIEDERRPAVDLGPDWRPKKHGAERHD